MKPSHIIILLIVILVVFGASKLPDIAKSVGQSAKILKKEMRELQEDDGKDDKKERKHDHAKSSSDGDEED